MNNRDKKELVKRRYSELALNSAQLKSSCGCGTKPTAPSKKIYTILSEDYSGVEGYQSDADLGVGCGLPVKYAGIKAGDTVIDLGSGAGNDCFVAHAEVGERGRVIGVDFSPEMVKRARENVEKSGHSNIEIVEGDIEQMPIEDGTADVVVSNCVLNLLPEKNRIFHEIRRVLKSGGHFCISDIVLDGSFPDAFLSSASMYAGCIASAIQREEYLKEITKAGFEEVNIVSSKSVMIPQNLLEEHLDQDTIAEYVASNVGIYSITVVGRNS